MAKSKSSRTPRKSKSFSEALGINYIINDKSNFIYGAIFIAFAIFMIIAFCSYFSAGQADQSLVTAPRPGEIENVQRVFQNSCGSIGAYLSHFLIARCFGIPAFLIPFYLILCGARMMNIYRVNLIKWFFGTAIVMIWSSVAMAKFITPLIGDQVFNAGGDHGAFICQWLENVIGAPGLLAVLFLTAIAFLTYLTSETIVIIRKMLNPIGYLTHKVTFTITNNEHKSESESEEVEVISEPIDEPVSQPTEIYNSNNVEEEPSAPVVRKPKADDGKETDFDVDVAAEEEKAQGKDVAGAVDFSTPINPREPWTRYKFPTLDLLKKYDTDGRPYVDNKEQESNKNRIISVLLNFGVEIDSIRATVGPTITLYEITPKPGVRISKIKNLEDDIALSLAALGIRIIAPMPGKGTIGIEVPNANPNVVSMLSILNSRKFQEAKMELPLALGKTITNEVFMVDLAKIPHLLVAGATGQGKSVGMNAIITSLLYKKHPNELKFVLVDPKKVEFSVYAPIADHFMAALEENEDEPIITDTQKVVKTLKGLCVLMDSRYDLLKKAGARNIKEYNAKYLNHKLNPNDGHEFMPYIVAIVDEFADLIMTAGKEVEMPITRIAQLARAVGIHMVIATQRPSTKVITGGIKANFPGRIAFKVAQRIDSSIILDRTGAHQLIGRGDMLYSNGGEPVRVQCAFVDTPEVERINEFVANQPGPRQPLELPEPLSEDGGGVGGGSVDAKSLDPLFEEAARHIVVTQQGSTSMVQRRFSIGYNRAGRLMDQLEQAGIVGAAMGSKPREVLISDEVSLDNLLATLR
jgi:S-DNA-T family DNA segregation ATPase FtsK/SpoIIIE